MFLAYVRPNPPPTELLCTLPCLSLFRPRSTCRETRWTLDSASTYGDGYCEAGSGVVYPCRQTPNLLHPRIHQPPHLLACTPHLLFVGFVPFDPWALRHALFSHRRRPLVPIVSTVFTSLLIGPIAPWRRAFSIVARSALSPPFPTIVLLRVSFTRCPPWLTMTAKAATPLASS